MRLTHLTLMTIVKKIIAEVMFHAHCVTQLLGYTKL